MRFWKIPGLGLEGLPGRARKVGAVRWWVAQVDTGLTAHSLRQTTWHDSFALREQFPLPRPIPESGLNIAWSGRSGS